MSRNVVPKDPVPKQTTSNLKLLVRLTLVVVGITGFVTCSSNILFPYSLKEAVKDHRVRDLSWLLQFCQIPCVNGTTDRFGRHLLYQATREDDLASVSVLLKHGAIPNTLNYHMLRSNEPDYESALHLAIDHGKGEIAHALLRAGANPNLESSEHHRTPLLIALGNKRYDLVKLLLSFGADASYNDYVESDYLNFKDNFPSSETFELIKQHAADPLLSDSAGNSALHLAVYYGNHAAVQRLLTHGADPRQKNKLGLNPLELASTLHTQAAREERAKVEFVDQMEPVYVDSLELNVYPALMIDDLNECESQLLASMAKPK